MKKLITEKNFKTSLFMLVLMCISVCGYAQETTIGGIVTDNNNSPLPGVSIIVKGTSIGTVTDIDGNYSLKSINRDNILVFSFIGYATQEVAVNGRTTIDITLKEDAQRLDEVVVVGYGEQRKATLTGSVTYTGGEELERSPAISVSNSLAGMMPGLIALNRTGEPGADVSQLLIRGQNTTGSTSPMVVVDGVPDEVGAWQRIPQHDIEQISILKDASAAIYGARAANGVILITTKRGKVGKPTFNYSFNQGIVQPTRVAEMANSWEWAEFVNQRLVEHENLPPRFSEEEIKIMREGTDQLNYPNVQWGKEILKDFASQNKHILSLRGGSEEIRYSVSGSYSNQNSIVKNGLHNFNGYTWRSNLDAKITENITFTLDVNGSIDEKLSPQTNDWGHTKIPIMPIQWPNGTYSAPPSDYGENPALNMTGVGGYYDDKIRRNIIKAGFDMAIPVVEGLSIDGYFAYTNQNTHNRSWRETWEVFNYDPATDEYTVRIGGRVSKPDLNVRNSTQNNYLAHFKVSYQRQFGDHYLSSFIGAEQAEGNYERVEAYRRDFVSPAIDQLFAGSASDMEANGYLRETARQNLIGRVSYNFQEKYLIDVNLRYDGSYAFPPGNRWGFFPGVSAAWRLDQEGFLSDQEAIDALKFRVSYGQMGNDQISPFQFLAVNNLRAIGTHFGEPKSTQPSVYPGVAPNPNITWEVATTQNIGLDGVLWKGMAQFSVDVFQQTRSNILTTREAAIPYYTGLRLPDENIGEIRNRGVELELTHRNQPSAGRDFTYSLSGNIAFARNKIIDISEPQDVPDYQKAEGNVIGAGLYYNAIGIFRTQEQVDSNPIVPGTRVGDLQYEDINTDGIINAADRIRVAKGIIPEVTYGFNGQIGYKNFSLFAHFAGNDRVWVYQHQNARTGLNGLRDLIVNRYTPGSMDSKYPIIPQEWRPDRGDVSGLSNTFWLQDVSFVRLKTLELAYEVPASLTSRIGVTATRIYLNGTNLFTITDADWFDPEVSHSQNDTGMGSPNFYYLTGGYPQNKVYNIGINITL
jgi:TonB-linked SusC/RagA family outer membrane protein